MKKVIRALCAVVMFVAFMFLMGAAGASDLEQITMHHMVIQMAVSILVFALGAYGLKVTE